MQTSRVTVNEVEFLDADSPFGAAGETASFLKGFLDTWSPVLKSFLGPLLAIVMFIVFLRMLKKFKPSERKSKCLTKTIKGFSPAHELGKRVDTRIAQRFDSGKAGQREGTALRRYLETGSST